FSRLVVQLRQGLVDVGFIDLLSPVRGRDFFECDRDGLVSVVQDLHDVLRDCLGESSLLLFGLSWPQLHDDVRHYSLLYSWSLTFSIHSTALPLSCSCTAMCVTAVVGAAPCQCFSPGGIQITSPGRISSIGPPQRCSRPEPAVTITVWPSGWVCQAVRARGSNVTLAPSTRAGSGAWNSGSMRTVPVNHSAGPMPEGCEPILLMSIEANRSGTEDAGVAGKIEKGL